MINVNTNTYSFIRWMNSADEEDIFFLGGGGCAEKKQQNLPRNR